MKAHIDHNYCNLWGYKIPTGNQLTCEAIVVLGCYESITLSDKIHHQSTYIPPIQLLLKKLSSKWCSPTKHNFPWAARAKRKLVPLADQAAGNCKGRAPALLLNLGAPRLTRAELLQGWIGKWGILIKPQHLSRVFQFNFKCCQHVVSGVFQI